MYADKYQHKYTVYNIFDRFKVKVSIKFVVVLVVVNHKPSHKQADSNKNENKEIVIQTGS